MMKRSPTPIKEPKSTDEWLQMHIGEEIDCLCPLCGEPLYSCNAGDIWCSCGYSNDQQLSSFIKSLGAQK